MSKHKIHLEVKIHFRVLMGHLDRDLLALKDLKVSHLNSIVDKDLEEHHLEIYLKSLRRCLEKEDQGLEVKLNQKDKTLC